MNPNYEAFMCVNESLAVVWQWKEGSYFKAGPFEIITRKNKTVWLPWLSGLCVVSNGPSPLGQLSRQHKYNTNIDDKQLKLQKTLIAVIAPPKSNF